MLMTPPVASSNNKYYCDTTIICQEIKQALPIFPLIGINTHGRYSGRGARSRRSLCALSRDSLMKLLSVELFSKFSVGVSNSCDTVSLDNCWLDVALSKLSGALEKSTGALDKTDDLIITSFSSSMKEVISDKPLPLHSKLFFVLKDNLRLKDITTLTITSKDFNAQCTFWLLQLEYKYSH